METYNKQPIDYAGDGVYVLVDNQGIELRTNNYPRPTAKVYVEDQVMDAILRIRENGRAIIKSKKKKGGKVMADVILTIVVQCKESLADDIIYDTKTDIECMDGGAKVLGSTIYKVDKKEMKINADL